MNSLQFAKSFVDESNPTIKSLATAFGGLWTGKAQSRANIIRQTRSERQDVVSEKLCDDILAYLAPTLEQYKGCTIIDVHPGACLWSSKVHDFLKPQRHVLMEPEKGYYDPFIKPLLDKSGSTYRWTPLPGSHPTEYFQNYQKVFDDPDLMPPRPRLDAGDPAKRQLDHSLLLIGNLARRYTVRRVQPRGMYWTTVLQQMAHASLTNSLVHRDGLVRMLWWYPESDKSLVFPTTEVWRQSFQAGISLAANITEVAGTTLPGQSDKRAFKLHRIPFWEDIMARRVRQTMREKGMSPPEHRPLLAPDEQNDTPISEVISPLDAVSHTVKELSEEVDAAFSLLQLLRETYKTSPPSQAYLNMKARSPKLANTNTIWTVRMTPLGPELKFDFPQVLPATEARLDLLAANFAGGPRRLAAHVELALRTIRLEATLKELEEGQAESGSEVMGQKAGLSGRHPEASVAEHASRVEGSASATLATEVQSGDVANDSSTQPNDKQNGGESSHQTRGSSAELDELRKRILLLDDEHMVAMAQRGDIYVRVAIELIDEQISLTSPTPILLRDRREYEPLKAEATEFWPRAEMTLLDMVPSGRDISVPDLVDVQESQKLAYEIIRRLFLKKASPLATALDRLGPNAAQDLIPMVPAITDARKGGRLNPNRMKARMITDEMLAGLTKATVEWPFRPTTLELELMSVGGGAESATDADAGVL